mgnify:FL=1
MDGSVKGSIERPVYTLKVNINDEPYDLTGACISMELNDQDSQMAQRATVVLHNITINTQQLTNLIKVRACVFIYADDGAGAKEVFRGFVWRRDYTSSLSERDFSLICYDQLIYLQESEDNEYFAAGKGTDEVMASLCEKWGLELEYDYDTITHDKLILKGDLSNIFTEYILNFVQKATGKPYVIQSVEDKVRVVGIGQNAVRYDLLSKKNVVQTKSVQTMEGMVTKAVIYGKEGTDSRPQVEATIEANTDEYGTIQKVISSSSGTNLAEAKKEAQTLVDDGSTPLWEYEVEAPDIPWIRKGDKVYINAGDIYEMVLIVRSITHSVSNDGAKMSLSLDDGHRRFISTSVGTSVNTNDDSNGGDSSSSVNTSFDFGAVDDGTLTSAQKNLIYWANNTAAVPANRCATWTGRVFNNAGLGYLYGNGNDQTWAFCHSNNPSELKPGMLVGCASHYSGGSAGIAYGHVAIYVGNDTIISPELGMNVRYTVSQFINVYGNGTGVYWGWGNNIALA